MSVNGERLTTAASCAVIVANLAFGIFVKSPAVVLINTLFAGMAIGVFLQHRPASKEVLAERERCAMVAQSMGIHDVADRIRSGK